VAQGHVIDLGAVIRKLNGSLRSKKVAILGYAFKKDTGDTRESQAAEVVRLLRDESPLEIAIYDPQCTREVIEKELNEPDVRSIINVCDRASAVLILTEWDEFRHPAKDAKAFGHKTQFTTRERLLPEPECDSNCSQCLISTAAKRATGGAIDWFHTAAIMSAPKLVFDGRGVVDPVMLQAMGFRVEAIGKANASSM
jgi:UDPglucose 6-dehydrogenase